MIGTAIGFSGLANIPIAMAACEQRLYVSCYGVFIGKVGDDREKFVWNKRQWTCWFRTVWIQSDKRKGGM